MKSSTTRSLLTGLMFLVPAMAWPFLAALEELGRAAREHPAEVADSFADRFISKRRSWALAQSAQQSRDATLSGLMPSIGGSWTELGPAIFNGIDPASPNGATDETMSGQVSAIAVDLVHDPRGDLVYIGSSAGGLWKSTNGLAATPQFLPLSDQSQSLSVGAIALDTRSDPPTIFVGSGAPDNAANIASYTGTGILISHDNGQTWNRISTADGGAHPFVGLGFSRILIDPVTPDLLVASTGIGIDRNAPHAASPQGDPGFQNLGIYRSSDAGQSWSQTMSANFVSGKYFHIDLAYEPTQQLYFAGVSQQGIFRSSDGGNSWQPVPNPGSLASTQMNRISLATRNGVLWALLMTDDNPPPPFNNAFQLYESDDHAASWHQIAQGDISNLTFKGHLMYVAAPPNSNTLLVAMEHIFRNDNIGDPNSHFVDIDKNIHGDQHAIEFADANIWYAGDDGGAWVTTNRGDAWSSLNDQLHTLEFFSADADSSGSGTYFGGMQDNGVALSMGGATWNQFVLGDGLNVAADPQDPGAFFYAQPFGNIFYVHSSDTAHPSSVISFQSMKLPVEFLLPFELLPNDPALYTGASPPPNVDFTRSRFLLTGEAHPWLVAFDPVTNTPAQTQLTDQINSIVNYVAPVPGDPTTAYVVADRSLYRLTNISLAHSATVTQMSGAPINGEELGALAVSPADSATLYLTKVGFLHGEKIYETTDGGTNWTNISGNLPNVPVNWVMIDRANPKLVIVATDVGVFAATDGGVGGEQWKVLGSGLPNVPVVQTKVSAGQKLIAATFGRNVWTLDMSKLEVQPIAKCKDVAANTDPDLCVAAKVSIDNGSTDPDGDSFTISQSPGGPYPRGVTTATLTITDENLESSQCVANVTVLDRQPPNIACPSPIVECTSPNGASVPLNPAVSDNCPGLAAAMCQPPSGSTFPLGVTPFTCSVTDASNNSSSCNSTVTVQDTTPPVISSISASPNVLWPPNHKLAPVAIDVSVHDTCDPNPICAITAVASNEPPAGGGSGNTSPDFVITGPLSVQLRAERDGTGTGRVYTVSVQCTDHSNNASQGSTTVTVPHGK